MDNEKLEVSRRPNNRAEGICFDMLTYQLGWRVSKRGWPDFICQRPDGSFCAVEVKKQREIPLKHNQEIVLQLFASAGIDCFRYTPEEGLVPIPPKQE